MSRLILFDFDGTLVDSGRFFEQAIFDYSDKHHLQRPNAAKVQKNYMNAKTVDFEWGLALDEQLFHMRQFFDWYDAKTAQEQYLMPIPYDGIIDALQTLDKDFSMGVVTSRPSPSTKSTLDYHDLSGFFKDIRTRCDQKLRGHSDKPSGDKINCIANALGYEKKDVIMIGDTCADIGAAHDANVKSIAVTWGYQDRNHLATQKPTFMIDQVTDLVKTIEKAIL